MNYDLACQLLLAKKELISPETLLTSLIDATYACDAPNTIPAGSHVKHTWSTEDPDDWSVMTSLVNR